LDLGSVQTSGGLDAFESNLLAKQGSTDRSSRHQMSYRDYCKHLGKSVFVESKDVLDHRGHKRQQGISSTLQNIHDNLASRRSHLASSLDRPLGTTLRESSRFKHFKCYVPGEASLKYGHLRKIDSEAIEDICGRRGVDVDWDIVGVKKDIKTRAAQHSKGNQVKDNI